MSVVVGTSTGKVYLYNLKAKKLAATRGEAKKDNGVIGLDWIDAQALGNNSGSKMDILFANKKGELLLCPLEDELKTTGENVGQAGAVAMQHSGRSVVIGSADGSLNLTTLAYDGQEDLYSVAQTRRIFETSSLPGLSNLQVSKQGFSKLAALCQDKPPVVLDVESESTFWTAKNVPADELQLKVPMFDTSCTFADEANLLYTATAYGKYDFRLPKRRPLVDIVVDKHGLLKVAHSSSTGNVYAGSNSGQIFVLDPRMNHSVVKKFNEAHGAITDLAFSRDESFLCSASLDRHLRIYNLASSELVREEFMFQKLEKCAFSDEQFDFDEIDIEESEDEEEKAEEHATIPLFRDKLKSVGGKLTHNYIKLKYERRHQQAEQTAASRATAAHN